MNDKQRKTAEKKWQVLDGWAHDLLSAISEGDIEVALSRAWLVKQQAQVIITYLRGVKRKQ